MSEPSMNGQGADAGTSRRQFLKVLGASGAGAATLSACGPPAFADRLLPKLVDEEGIIPGVSTRYATLLTDAGPEPVPVWATVRDGRVLKLEGNPTFPGVHGRISALAQASLQDLYDPDRVRAPLRRGADAAEPEPENEHDEGWQIPDGFGNATWDEAIAALGTALDGSAVILTGAVSSATAAFYRDLAAATGARHIAWEAFSTEAFAAAGRQVYGSGSVRYDLSQADYIVCLGADFLGTWLAPVRLAAGFASARDIEAGRHAKFVFIGPRMSTTGTNADTWIQARPGSEALIAEALAGSGSLDGAAEAAGVAVEVLAGLRSELQAASSPVVLPPGVESQGADATRAHVAVARLNQSLGAVGRTVQTGGGGDAATASFQDLLDLVADMRDGSVQTLVVAGPNPAYALPASAGFVDALGQVANVFSISTAFHDTAALAGWVLPCHHALEAWTDAELPGGAAAIGQPVMLPIFDTRQREDILIQAAGGTVGGATDFRTYLANAWSGRAGGGTGWMDTLKRGGSWPGAAAAVAADTAAATAAAASPADTLAAATDPAGESQDATPAATPATAPPTATGSTTLVVYPTVQFYDGRGANKSWMQELPDPVTKIVWNSWVEVHPDRAEELGVEHGDVVRVTSAAGELEAPVYVNRGIRPDVIAIPLGQGHTAYGRNAAGRGVNPLDLLPASTDGTSGALAYAGTPVEIEATGGHQMLVNTQGNDDDLGREIAELLNVEDALSHIQEHEVDLTRMVEAAWDSDPDSPYRWGMTIDLNACIGCGACVTACYAENNIPTVGEELCSQRREMSWLRIHRFHEETEDHGFQTVHTPALCQQCGDAPCEPVCPVYATYHNPEGLNVQVYNRCVGTRYCANNCPYKVRRFNWFTYEFPYPLNLQLNPDVTVREKGVMDKCTFCVQRINRAKLDAKEEGRIVEDGEVVTACQQTCPTQAIKFGNLKDPDSEVSRLSHSARGYHMLHELGTRPAITYLEGVTHAHPVAADHGPAGGGDHAAETAEEEAH